LQGSIRLFRFAGIDLFLHWSWFLVAVYEINGRSRTYTSVTWNVVEYLGLFFIIMLHEFGHALACRQVGGTADRIVLWPLGGVAYVNPPQRPGATLWSIAAGPLVNVAFVFIFMGLGMLNRMNGWENANPNLHPLLHSLAWINLGLLIFNLLPVYPLDGGQILRSLLWFVLGRARSLMAAVVVGFLGVAGLIGLAVWMRSVWFGLIAAFILMNCWNGLKQAQALARLAKLPRTPGFACPSCHTPPPVGAFWKCNQCGQPFDTFQSRAVCPNCKAQFEKTVCLDCRAVNPMSKWIETPPASWR
jgi:Zn-dependent protease